MNEIVYARWKASVVPIVVEFPADADLPDAWELLDPTEAAQLIANMSGGQDDPAP